MTLLDVRSESYIAVGDLKLAAADANGDEGTGQARRRRRLQARALCRETAVRIPRG
jgi:hypothetical protein